MCRSALKVVTPAHGSGADFDWIEIVRKMRDRGRERDHVRRIAAIAADASDFVDVFAGETGVATTMAAITAHSAEPAHADPLADRKPLDPRAQRLDDADPLVARNARILDEGKQLLHGDCVAMTDAAGLDAQAYFLRARNGDVPLFRNERAPALPNDHRTHFRHGTSSCGSVYLCGSARGKGNERPALLSLRWCGGGLCAFGQIETRDAARVSLLA